MSLIKLHDKTFEPYVTAVQLQEIVARVADEIYQDLGDSRPVFVCILNGSFMFAADLVRRYKGLCELSFVKMASYEGTQSSGKIHHLIGLSDDLEGKDVVVIEDIVDTGNTLEEIYRIFADKKVHSFRIATLFFKPDAYTKDLKIDYVGKPIPNRFAEYNEKTAPLIAYYQQQGKYYPIDGIGSIEEITQRLSQAIDLIKSK